MCVATGRLDDVEEAINSTATVSWACDQQRGLFEGPDVGSADGLLVIVPPAQLTV